MVALPLLIAVSLAPLQTQANQPALHCVKTLDAYEKPSEMIDYRGVRYGTCCAGCAAAFINEPEVWIKKAIDSKVLIGYGLFDPVSGARVIGLAKSPYSDYKAVRYYFKEASEKATFDANPEKFAKAPEKELMYCPVQPQPLEKETDSAGYVDYNGTRYYVCCGNCYSAITRDPSRYVSKFPEKVTPASAHLVKPIQ